jgi:hypothetical protein
MFDGPRRSPTNTADPPKMLANALVRHLLPELAFDEAGQLLGRSPRSRQTIFMRRLHDGRPQIGFNRRGNARRTTRPRAIGQTGAPLRHKAMQGTSHVHWALARDRRNLGRSIPVVSQQDDLRPLAHPGIRTFIVKVSQATQLSPADRFELQGRVHGRFQLKHLLKLDHAFRPISNAYHFLGFI